MGEEQSLIGAIKHIVNDEPAIICEDVVTTEPECEAEGESHPPYHAIQTEPENALLLHEQVHE